MHRRDVFHLAFQSGAVAVVTRLAGTESVEAAELEAAAKVEFQKGNLRGGAFEGWEALLAITGRAVRGTVYDPGSLGGARFTGYRVRGTARGAVLDLDFYELEDVAFEKPVGGGRGREKRGKTTTHFEIEGKGLAGKQSGSMASRSVTTAPRSSRHLAGQYQVVIVDMENGGNVAEFELVAAADGKFAINALALKDTPGAPAAVAGRFGSARDGTIYATMLLPDVEPGTLGFDASEVQLLKPAATQPSKRQTPPPGTNHDQPLEYALLLAACGRFVCPMQLDGTVTEVVGSPPRTIAVADARVEILHTPGYVVFTGTDGGYRFNLVPESDPEIRVSKAGYSDTGATLHLTRGRNIKNFVLLRADPARFSDEDFPEIFWSSQIVRDSVGGANSTEQQQSDGGNPGQYRRTVVTNVAEDSFVICGHIYRNRSYDPAVSGALSTVTFGYSLKFFGSDATAPRITPLLRQDGVCYVVYAPHLHRAAPREWTLMTTDAIPVGLFRDVDNNQADFSAQGSPIEFGYAVIPRGNGNHCGIDNWSCVVTKA